MKFIAASAFGLALMCSGAASAAGAGVGAHIGPVGIGVGAHIGHGRHCVAWGHAHHARRCRRWR